MKNPMIGLALGASAALAALLPAGAAAQAGARPLSIIVPQPAGNPTDGVARKIQPLLQAQLQRTVIVENQPGAGGLKECLTAHVCSRDGSAMKNGCRGSRSKRFRACRHQRQWRWPPRQ